MPYGGCRAGLLFCALHDRAPLIEQQLCGVGVAALRPQVRDGVRIVDAERGWVLVLPDPADAVTHLWAEGGDADSAQLMLDEWAAVVEGAEQ